MAAANEESKQDREPRGFGKHTRGLSGEYAHEQGWGLDVEERTKQPDGPQDRDGGTDYEYGARDFGDEPVNTDIPENERDPTQNRPIQQRRSDREVTGMSDHAQPQQEELKKHGDELANALKDTGSQSGKPKQDEAPTGGKKKE